MYTSRKYKYFISYSYKTYNSSIIEFDNGEFEARDLESFENIIELEEQIKKNNNFKKVKILYFKVIDNNYYFA